MYLPDTNVWLALAFESHTHHPAAKVWMRTTAPHSVSFCRITQLGFLRLASNPKAFPNHAVSMKQAWEMYDTILNDRRVAFTDEPIGLASVLRDYSQLRSFSTNVWTDAYLAAFAKIVNYEFVTFDKGFVQFAGLRYTILS